MMLETIEKALVEDLGDGDHTSLATIPKDVVNKAQLLVKEDGIIAGIDVAQKVFNAITKYKGVNNLNIPIWFTPYLTDGAQIKKGDVAFVVEGAAQHILMAERTVLNFMQRMSGIATHTARLVRLLEGTNTKILDTRKTSPGLRQFEKNAVRIGGATNHRFGLYDMIMIKDNHVDYAGGIANAIDRVVEYKNCNHLNIKVEVEVRNISDLQITLNKAFDNNKQVVDIIMFDNFSVDEMKKAVTIVREHNKNQEKIYLEASGGITEQTIREYAETGVDYISVGALTHNIKSLDLSLKAV